MAAISSPTGVDGVIAGGNTPTWIVQEATVKTPLTSKSLGFPLEALTAATTVKADCHMDMDGVEITRETKTRDRQRMCEKVTVTVPTGETVNGSITAIYDQQAEAAALINAVYTALPEGATVYVVRAYGLDSNTEPSAKTKVDVVRAKVSQRNKNQPVAGEDLMATATLAGDLYLQDVTLSA